MVNEKIKAALANDLIPIMCIGETLAEREAGDVEIVIKEQLAGGLADFSASAIAKLIIAYEPVWAIGTGKTATPAQVDEVHGFIRSRIGADFGESLAASIRILYGGSVKPANSKELLALENVDGALVGGASLKCAEFIEIIKNAH